MIRLSLLAVVLTLVGGRAATPAGPVPCEAQAASPKAGKYDPYGYATYTEFRAYMARGVSSWGVLYVGVPDRSVGTYEPHCRVPSGFKGLADGVYDCRHDRATGQPTMQLRPKPLPLPADEGWSPTAEGWYWRLAPPGGYCPPTG